MGMPRSAHPIADLYLTATASPCCGQRGEPTPLCDVRALARGVCGHLVDELEPFHGNRAPAATCSHSYIDLCAGGTIAPLRPKAIRDSIEGGLLRLEKNDLSLKPRYSCAQRLWVGR